MVVVAAEAAVVVVEGFLCFGFHDDVELVVVAVVVVVAAVEYWVFLASLRWIS